MTLKLAEKGDDLSPREWQVLTLMTQGLTTKQIGRHIGISPRTTEIHRANVIWKLGARTSVQAVVLALTYNITSLDAEVHPEAPQTPPRRGPQIEQAMADVDAWLKKGGRLGLPLRDKSRRNGGRLTFHGDSH